MTDDLREILLSYVKTLRPAATGDDLDEIAANLQVATYTKGTRLACQGEVASHCYFVLKGCLRTFHVTEDGQEHTAEFYIEQDSLTILESYRYQRTSPFSIECLEDSTVILGQVEAEERLMRQSAELGAIIRRGLEEGVSRQLREQARFRSQSPEARYREFLRTRPGLAGRVAQYQLASFLGMTPESLSRIKRRLYLSPDS